MAASVIVTSYNSHDILVRCLDALRGQPCSEIIVADCSETDPEPMLTERFPGIQLVRFSQPVAVPAMRWAALHKTKSDIVLALEARCIPASDWVEKLMEAHAKHPDSPAIGGAVSNDAAASLFDWALFFCEYGHYATPLSAAESPDISGANLSYKRAVLMAEMDLLESGSWETLLHLRWRARGLKLRTAAANVEFHNTMSPIAAVMQRFHYGRGFAGNRSRRLLYSPLPFILPVILIWRMLRDAVAKGSSAQFLLALPWVIVLTCSWSSGELFGYLLGPGRKQRIF